MQGRQARASLAACWVSLVFVVAACGPGDKPPRDAPPTEAAPTAAGTAPAITSAEERFASAFGTPVAAAGVDLSAMVLPLDDLGPAYAHLVLAPDAGPVDNARAATTSWEPDDSAADMQARGRIDGYTLWFNSSDPNGAAAGADGIFAVGTSVEAMTDAGMAKQYLLDDISFASTAVGDDVFAYTKLGEMVTFDAGQVGDAAYGVGFRLDPQGNKSTWLAGVIFARGNLAAAVYVSRLNPTYAEDEAIRLARLLDERIVKVMFAPPETPVAGPRATDDAVPPEDFELGNSLGMRCSYPSRFLRERYGLGPGSGCVILRVTSGGAAEHAGIQIGDRLIRVDDVPVTSGRQFVFEVLEYGVGPHQVWTVQRGQTEMSVDFWWGVPGSPAEHDPYREYLAGRDNVGPRIDIQHLTNAIEADPGFDLAYLYRGQRRFELASLNGDDPSDAQADVLEALRLDPDLPEAHEMLAQMLSNAGNFTDALREINIALGLSSCDGPPAYWDYDCGALLLTRARIYLMQPIPDDLRAEADVNSARDVRSLDAERRELADAILQARVNNALRNGTCEQDGTPVPCQ